MGGEVVPSVYAGIPDFAVVPTCGASLRHAVNEIVTDLFVVSLNDDERTRSSTTVNRILRFFLFFFHLSSLQEDCRNQEQIVDLEYYHKPFSISKDINPLTGCIVTLSMYTGVERMYLSRLAEELGAM